MVKKENREEFMRRLAEQFPDPKSELHYSTPYELLVAVALSAQATDGQTFSGRQHPAGHRCTRRRRSHSLYPDHRSVPQQGQAYRSHGSSAH